LRILERINKKDTSLRNIYTNINTQLSSEMIKLVNNSGVCDRLLNIVPFRGLIRVC